MTSVRAKFLDPAALDSAAHVVLEIAFAEKVPVAFAGGYVLQLYGSPRLTGDIDVVAASAIAALPAHATISFGGYKSSLAGVPVDVILRNDDWQRLYSEALAHFTIKDGLPVIPLEYIVAMKLVAGRGKDNDDVVFLIATEAVELEKVRSVVREHLGPYALRDLESLTREAVWRAAHGEFST